MTIRCGLVIGLLAALCIGCSRPPVQPSDPLLPTPTEQQKQELAATPGTPQPEVTATPAHPDVSGVKLVPLSPKAKLRFSLDYPEGWSVKPTLAGDSVQIANSPLRIMVQVEQLREKAVPKNAAELETILAPNAREVRVNQVEFPGSRAAFEVVRTYDVDTEVRRDLILLLYGTTHMMTVTTSAPSYLYSEWEPVFHQILATVKPGNLDAEVLGGRL